MGGDGTHRGFRMLLSQSCQCLRGLRLFDTRETCGGMRAIEPSGDLAWIDRSVSQDQRPQEDRILEVGQGVGGQVGGRQRRERLDNGKDGVEISRSKLLEGSFRLGWSDIEEPGHLRNQTSVGREQFLLVLEQRGLGLRPFNYTILECLFDLLPSCARRDPKYREGIVVKREPRHPFPLPVSASLWSLKFARVPQRALSKARP